MLKSQAGKETPGIVEKHDEERLKMIIVSVDDDVRSRDFVKRALQQQQYIVEDFDTALDAMNYIRDNSVDVALIDYRLARGPDGLQLARQVRLMRPECVIVMISAFADRDQVIEAMQVGADDFIVKTKITPEQLVQRVGDAILRRRRWYPSLLPSIRYTGDLEIDVAGKRAVWHGERLRLTAMEFQILAELTSKAG